MCLEQLFIATKKCLFLKLVTLLKIVHDWPPEQWVFSGECFQIFWQIMAPEGFNRHGLCGSCTMYAVDRAHLSHKRPCRHSIMAPDEWWITYGRARNGNRCRRRLGKGNRFCWEFFFHLLCLIRERNCIIACLVCALRARAKAKLLCRPICPNLLENECKISIALVEKSVSNRQAFWSQLFKLRLAVSSF